MIYIKKIENWLLLPVLILFSCSFGLVGHTLDFHLHDTYFVFEGVSTFRLLASFLLIIFGLYKTIRNRHQTINRVFAVPHILISILLTGLLLMPLAAKQQYIDYTQLDYSDWNSYRYQWQLPVMAGLSFLLIQAIFFIFFIAQLLKKPVIQR
jgi:hypothetical protein